MIAGLAAKTCAAALVVLAAACAPAPSAGPLAATPAQPSEKAMDQGPSASRRPPPKVEPVVQAGVRYQEDAEAAQHGGDQPGGYLVAIDERTGGRLWMLKVYQIGVPPPGVPRLARHFKRLALADGGKALEIENESGGVYRVDLAKHSVTQTGGPPESGDDDDIEVPPPPE